MKTILSFFICIHILCGVKAQDANYKGPARMLVMAFWNEAGKLQNNKGGSVINLESILADTKRKDLAYNTTAMEDELKKWKAKNSNNGGIMTKQDSIKAKNQMLTDIAAMNNDLSDCFDRPTFHVSRLATAQKELDEFKAKANYILERKEILAAFKERHKDGYYRILTDKMLEYSDVPLSRQMNDIGIIIADSKGDPGGNWENCYYDMQCMKAYWDAAQKTFPEIPQFADAYKKCVALADKYGTKEQIYAITQVNKTAALKARKLPAPVVKDAALEKILIEGFNKRYGPAYNAKAVKAVLTQDGWTTERNAITGIVTGRNRTGKIAYKTLEGDGKCYLLAGNIFIYEEFIGGAFANTRVIYNGLGSEEMLCENVK